MQAQTVYETEEQIVEDQLPASPGLKIVRDTDPDSEIPEDDEDAREEFIAWYLRQEHVLLFSIPEPGIRPKSVVPDQGAFSTVYGPLEPFVESEKTPDRFHEHGGYMQALLTRIRDWAITHSIVGSLSDRAALEARYERLVESHFRTRLSFLVRKFKFAGSADAREAFKDKIGELNGKILLCRKVWREHAEGTG
jgi:hypothetical protein